jgi:hypothetical protein
MYRRLIEGAHRRLTVCAEASDAHVLIEIDTLVAMYRSQAEAAGIAPQYTGIEDGPPSKRVKMEEE